MRKTKFITLVEEGLEMKKAAAMPLILDEGLSELMEREEGELIPLHDEKSDVVKDLGKPFIRITKAGIDIITPKFIIKYSLISRGLNYVFNPEKKEEPHSSEFKVSWSSTIYIRERKQESLTRTYSTQLSYDKKRGLQLYVGIDEEPEDEEERFLSIDLIVMIVDELKKKLESMNLMLELQDWVKG